MAVLFLSRAVASVKSFQNVNFDSICWTIFCFTEKWKTVSLHRCQFHAFTNKIVLKMCQFGFEKNTPYHHQHQISTRCPKTSVYLFIMLFNKLAKHRKLFSFYTWKKTFIRHSFILRRKKERKKKRATFSIHPHPRLRHCFSRILVSCYFFLLLFALDFLFLKLIFRISGKKK